jgi:hypothetical protein
MMFLCNKNTIKDFYDHLWGSDIFNKPVYVIDYSKSNNEYLSKDFGNVTMPLGLLEREGLDPNIYQVPKLYTIYIYMSLLSLLIGIIVRLIAVGFGIVNAKDDFSWAFVVIPFVLLPCFGMLIFVLGFNIPEIVSLHKEFLNKLTVVVALNREFLNNEKNKKSNEELIKTVNVVMTRLWFLFRSSKNEMIELLQNPEHFLDFVRNIIDPYDYNIIETIIKNNNPNKTND